MKKNIFALAALFAVVLGTVGFGFAQTKDNKKAKTTNQLLTLLPASEAAMAIDAKRLFGEALPQVLSGNQPLLSEILTRFDDIKARSGIDYKQFQQVAIGISSIKSANGGEIDFETLVLARGQFNSSGLMTAAKTAANGKLREEKIGERTVYIFSPQEAIEQNKGKIPNSKFTDTLMKMLAGLNKEMALTSYDDNTLVIGSLARVRELFDAKAARISAEVLGLVGRKPNAILNFGAQLPNGLAPFMDLDDDTLGKSLAGIRQLSGSMDIAGGSTVVSVAARTSEPEQATSLKDTLVGFQAFAGVLKGQKGEDKKVYGRMLENVRIVQTGNEVTLDLQVPQADINVIIGEKK